MGEFETDKVQEFLASQGFLRFARSFETYQKLFTEHNDAEQRRQMNRRMCEIFLDNAVPDVNQMGEEIDRVIANWKITDPSTQHESFIPAEAIEAMIVESREYAEILRQAVVWCEKGVFTKEKLAKALSESKMAETLMASWMETKLDLPGLVNEIIGYVIEKDGEKQKLEIELSPGPVKNPGELLEKVIDGFKIIAQKFKSGDFATVQKISMSSWLLADKFSMSINAIFGEEVTLQDVPEQDRINSSQKMALQFNKRSLEEFLLTGHRPSVRKLDLSREKFIELFGKD
ncbi:MAG: hypothetical protein WCX97_03830 [Candidatus Magasanikbacteria bacterium]